MKVGSVCKECGGQIEKAGDLRSGQKVFRCTGCGTCFTNRRPPIVLNRTKTGVEGFADKAYKMHVEAKKLNKR